MRCPPPPTHYISCNPDAHCPTDISTAHAVFTQPPEPAPRLQISRLGSTPTTAYAVLLCLPPTLRPVRAAPVPRPSRPWHLPAVSASPAEPWDADPCAAMPAGDVVIVEPALCWATLPDSWTTHCFGCCRRLRKAVPCLSCDSVSCPVYVPPQLDY